MVAVTLVHSKKRGDGYIDMESKFLKLASIQAALDGPVTLAQTLTADASRQEGLEGLVDAWSFLDVPVATEWGQKLTPRSLHVHVCLSVCVSICVYRRLCVCMCMCVCPCEGSSVPCLAPSSPCFFPSFCNPTPLATFWHLGWSFSWLPSQAVAKRRNCVSELQISTVLATAYYSINTGGVKKKNKVRKLGMGHAMNRP